MANFNFSAHEHGAPRSQESREVLIWSNEIFTTGEANTAVISELGEYSQRLLFIDITGAFTGGMSSPVTLAVSTKTDRFPVWLSLGTISVTSTAYLNFLNVTGGITSGEFVNLDKIKIIATNPNSGTGVGVTEVTATINIVLSLAG